MWIDSYDNLFSDFDSRHYAQRQISSDFFDEARKIIQEINPEKFALNLIIPQKKRNHRLEKIIIHRLHTIFKNYLHKEKKAYLEFIHRGILVVSIGIVAMTTAAIIDYFQIINFYTTMLTTFLEPGGWYCTWFGLDSIFYSGTQKRREIHFYQKLATAEILFHND